ncbi:MAG: RDD family protein, partial [Mucilaginibacter sp.]
MKTIKITTTQNIDIEYEVASLGDRFLARIVDAGVMLGVYYILYMVVIVFFFSQLDSIGREGGVPVFLIVLLIIFSLVYIFYDLVCEVFFNGQSIGKYAIKLRVVSLDGARPSISQYLLRWVFRIVDFTTTGGLGAVAIISVAVSEKKQRIGDIVAGTIVIKTTP